MQTIVLATRNEGKVQEIRAILVDIPIRFISLDEAGIKEEIEETGATLEENALLKARKAHEISRLPALADDSGLEVDALGGAPGVRSARYAGEAHSDAENRVQLLAEMSGIASEKRNARFRCVLALVGREGKSDKSEANERLFEGICYGSIGHQDRGTMGFGYDSVFIPDGLNETFAQLSAEQKNALSHRGKAVAALREYLQTSIDANG